MDIQVTYLLDAMRINSVTNVPGAVPRMLDIRGPDFRTAQRVEVNEIPVPTFVVSSRTRVLAQVPESQENEYIRTITVLSSGFTKTVTSKVKFELTLAPKKVSGLQLMMQTFLLYLLRSPGSDAWYPNTGGGIQKLIGSYFSRDNSGAVTAAFTLAVSRTRSQIISMQASNVRLSVDEKLASAKVLEAVFNVNQTALVARVELVAQSGKKAIVGVEL
jgi:hypothetical protein